MEIISGVYMITNIANNKKYIGCSTNIYNRWEHHKYEAYDKKQKPYNYSIHKAFRKYGLNNFKFEILEKTNNCFEREKYWIQYYNTYYNGYNETLGGDSGPVRKGETNGRAKLTTEEVYNIRQLCLEKKMPCEVFELYKDKISKRTFEHIWRGDNWKDILPEAIEYVHSKKYLSTVRRFAQMSRLKGENNES